MTDEAKDAPSVRPRRRGAAVALSLFTAGLGHVAIGRWRRGIIWYALYVSAFAGGLLAAWAGAPRLMWTLFGLVLAIWLTSAMDTLRLRRADTLPSAVTLALLAIVSVAFHQILRDRVKSNLLEAFSIPSGGMLPTLQAGDHLMTSKFPRVFERGAVVVVRYPLDPRITYVKRAVAVGGDSIEIRQDQLFLNGEPIPRQPSGDRCTTSTPETGCSLWVERLDGREYRVLESLAPGSDMAPIRVSDGHLFVIGDNRDNSNDSRVWGTVPHDLVVGRAGFLWWSSSADGVNWSRVNTAIR